MAETLRELVVSLSLQSDNFSKNIKSINAQIREVESRFDAAGAGVDGFAKSTDGLRAKAGMLTDKLELQKTVVGQYEQGLKRATDTLEKNKAKRQELIGKLDSEKAKRAELKTAIDQTSAALKKSVKDTGDNSEESIRLGVALLDLRSEYEATGAEIKKGEGLLTANANALQNNSNAVTKASDGLNKAKSAEGALRAELEKTNRAIKTHQAQWTAAAEKLEKFGDTATKAGQRISQAGQVLSASITAPLVALGGYALKASIDFESAFAGVEKSVEGSPEQLAEIRRELLDMSTQIPATGSELAKFAGDAGQLGIATENVVEFTRVMTDLKEATNLGDDGASQMAQFANITSMSQAVFSNAGSAIVELGNNMATTEKDIMAMALNLSSAGTQVKMSQADIFGLSAGLSSLGLEAQAGGTAFSKLMVDMQLAVETGNESLKDYAKIAGMTSEEFKKAFGQDAAMAIAQFISGLGSSGDSAIKILDDMGITETRMRDALLRASNASDLFSGAIDMANAAWKENTALTAEAAKRYATTESRISILRNKASLLAQTFGDDLSPAFGDIIDQAGEWIDSLANMDAGQRQTILTTAAWLAAIGPGVMLLGKMNTAVGSMATGLGKLIKTSVDAGGGLKGLFAATGSLLGPVGIAALAAAALYGAYKWYDYASGAKAAREATEAMIATAKEWQNTQAQTIYDTGNDPFARFGVDKSDFAGSIEESKDWIDRLVATWTDGKGETNQIVKEYVDEFVAGSDEIREAIEARKEAQGKLGASDPANDEYLAQLNAYDKEVEQLLKKRQNGFLTEDEIARLNEVIELRAGIELKFTTGEGSGYDTILKGVEAEKARLTAEAEGKGEPVKIGVDLYADALKAGAQGYTAQVDALNESYREQYAVVQSIEDGTQREIALTALNEQHQLALNAARAEYNNLVTQTAPEAFQSEETQKAQADMDALLEKISEFNEGEIDLTALEAFTETLDESTLAGYMALLAQLKESGLGDVNLAPDGEPAITASDLLGGYETIGEFLAGHAGTLPGLADMFGAAGDEAMRVLVDLGLTEEGQTLKDALDKWASDGIGVRASVTFSGIDRQSISDWSAANPTITLSGVKAEVGVKFGATWKTDLTTLWEAGKVQLYDGNGLPIDVDPSVPNPVKPGDIVVGVDENGVYHVIVAPEATGDPVKIQYYMEELDGPTGKPFSWDFSGLDEIGLITQAGQAMQEAGNGWQNLWGLFSGQQLDSLQGMVDALDSTTVTNMLAFVQETTTAINSGEDVSQEALDNLQKVQEFVSMLETLGIGEDIVAGIGQGMKEADWADPAATAATNLETALRNATGSHSPATKYIPIGQDIVAGIVKGVDDDTYKLKGAMIRMARAAVAAAKKELVIESPSRVLRDEVGVMMARGIGEGVLMGSKEQERIIANAARQMSSAAVGGIRNDNRRTYNQQTTLSLEGANFYIRDEQDVRSLAIEFAALTKRQQRGVGMRMV